MTTTETKKIDNNDDPKIKPTYPPILNPKVDLENIPGPVTPNKSYPPKERIPPNKQNSLDYQNEQLL